MNKLPIFISWVATIALLYIVHMKLMMAFPTPIVLIGSTIIAFYCYAKIAMFFGERIFYR